MRIMIDPGHGHSNRSEGVFDPGAVRGKLREADVVLLFATALGDECTKRDYRFDYTRVDNVTPTPLNSRVIKARQFDAHVLISLHCNAHDSEAPTGTETLYQGSRSLALRVHDLMPTAMRLRDRGVQYRSDLAVLKYKESVLIELGFISNINDQRELLNPACHKRVAFAICNGIQMWAPASGLG